MEIDRWQSGSNPAISVVLPTIPSTDHTDVLEKLKNQSFSKEWEVLVVVDDEPEDKRCAARNLGIREAEGDIIAHTDDDVSPPDTWLARIDSAFDQDVICVEGSVHGGMTYTGTGLYRGCNMAVRRDEALRVGGWNEDYVGWRDDTEFGWRLEDEADGNCIYRGNVRMEHPPYPRTTVKMDQEIRIFNKYPDKYRNRIPDSLKKRMFLIINERSGGEYLLRILSSISN